MPRDPGSVWKPLPEAGAPDGRKKNKFIVHSTGSNGTALGTWRYFANANVLAESTFIVGQGPWDPTLQCMDSSDIADANIQANDEGISVEVVGDGKGGYNSWQRAEIIRLGIWAHKTHGIPLQIIPSAAQDSGGYGWHIMFGAPGPWTSVAKICPGPVRIKELKEDIFPAIWRGEEDDMPLNDADKQWLRDNIGWSAYATMPYGPNKGQKINAGQQLRDIYLDVQHLYDSFAPGIPLVHHNMPMFNTHIGRIPFIEAQITALTEMVKLLAAGTELDADALIEAVLEKVGQVNVTVELGSAEQPEQPE